MLNNSDYSPEQQRQRSADDDSVRTNLEPFDPRLGDSAANNGDAEPKFDLRHLQRVVQTAIQQMYQRHATTINNTTRTNNMRAEYFKIEPDKPGGQVAHVRLLRPGQTRAPEELSILEGISWMTHEDNKPQIMSQLHRHLYTKEGRRGDYGQVIYPETVDVGKPIPKFALWQSPIRTVPNAVQGNPDQTYLREASNTEIIISMIPNPVLYESNPLSLPAPVLKCGALHLRGLSMLDSHSEPSASSNLVMSTFEVLKTTLSWRDRVPPAPSAKGPGAKSPHQDTHAKFARGYQFVGREMFFGPGLVLREYDWSYGTWYVRSHAWDATDDEGNVGKEIISIDDEGC